jgi:hypothetical protein
MGLRRKSWGQGQEQVQLNGQEQVRLGKKSC